MKRLIVVGSPRSNGRSAHLAEMLFEANIDERPEDELYLVPVSEIEVGPCIGCNACRKKSEVIIKSDEGVEERLMKNRCIFDDDMQTLYDLLDEVDQITVVSPVYFSGAPSTMKAVLDRLQPYFWANARAAEKRPSELHVIGEGGDPHGYGPLVSEVKSALAVAGFRLQRVYDWVGKIDENGEITAEADQEEVIWPAKTDAAAAAVDEGGQLNASDTAGGRGGSAKDVGSESKSRPASGRKGGSRPKLNLTAQKKGAKGGSGSRAGKQPGGRGAQGSGSGKRPSGKGNAAERGGKGRRRG